MALSDLYTTGSVAKKFSANSVIAGVYTRTFDEIFLNVNTEFDTSILFNNGSTSEMLNNGAYGNNFTAYNLDNLLYNGEPTQKIEFLGCAIVENLPDELTAINLSRKTTTKNPDYGYDWNSIKDCRFIINVVSSENIDYTDYVLFDVSQTSNIVYNFNTTYVIPYFYYKETNEQSGDSGYVHNPETLIGNGTDGNNGNRICSASFSVYTSDYNKYMSNTTEIQHTYIGKIVFAYRINGEYFLVNSPLNSPDYGYKHFCFTENNANEYLTIGGFGDFENGIGGFLPKSDETKGAFAFETDSSHSYRKNSNYFVTVNCAIYTLNSCGLRWILSDVLTTAKSFRENVRLGVMDENGIVNHKEWIVGETAIQASDNPNKDTNYDNIPDRNNNSGDLNDDIDDTLLGHDLYVNGFVNYFQVTAGNLTDISTAISNETEKTGLLNNVISLKSYVVPTSAFLSAGSTISAPIKINGVTVLESAPKIIAHSMKFHLGDYTINGRYGNLSNPHFLDKNPYTIIELYIPFCGIVTLPDKCMYNTISVDLLSDLFSGGCIAVVKCNGAIVAEKSGIIGYDIPLSSLNTAELSHALLNNVLKSVDIGANTIISGATGNIGGILSGAMSGANNMLSMYHTANLNYTTIVGNSGSKSEYALPPQCYVKITTKIIKYPDNYIHNVGKPCYKNKKLADCKGFTMCENVNINVSATVTEKQMIKQLLETGIYI